MSKRRQRTIERVEGAGTLIGGTERVPVSYEIRVDIEEIEAIPGEWLDGLKSIKGSVSAEDDVALLSLFQQEALTLLMEDGRRLDCFSPSRPRAPRIYRRTCEW